MLPVGEATSYVTENVNSGYMADQTVQEPIVNYKNVTYTIVQVWFYYNWYGDIIFVYWKLHNLEYSCAIVNISIPFFGVKKITTIHIAQSMR